MSAVAASALISAVHTGLCSRVDQRLARRLGGQHAEALLEPVPPVVGGVGAEVRGQVLLGARRALPRPGDPPDRYRTPVLLRAGEQVVVLAEPEERRRDDPGDRGLVDLVVPPRDPRVPGALAAAGLGALLPQPRAPLVAASSARARRSVCRSLSWAFRSLTSRAEIDHRAVPCGVGVVARVVTSEGRVIQRLGPSGTGSPSSCGTGLAGVHGDQQPAGSRAGVADVEQVREQATEAVAHQRPGVDDQQRPRRGEPLGPAGLHGLLHQADEVRPVAPAARPGVDVEHERASRSRCRRPARGWR